MGGLRISNCVLRRYVGCIGFFLGHSCGILRCDRRLCRIASLLRDKLDAWIRTMPQPLTIAMEATFG